MIKFSLLFNVQKFKNKNFLLLFKFLNLKINKVNIFELHID